MRQHSKMGEFRDSQPAFPPAVSGLFPAARPGSHTGYQVKAQRASGASFGIFLTAEIMMSPSPLQI